MDAGHLSHRLQIVASYVPLGARLADIGSDHAYLPAHLLLEKQISFAIAGEVAQGPLDNVQLEVRRHHFQNNLIPRLADGLAAIQEEDNIDTVTIAGMGGRLIAQILTDGHQHGEKYDHLILQPNIDVDIVRLWLQEHAYALTEETVVFEDGHYYDILVAEPGETTFSETELKYGPFNLKNHPQDWLDKWRLESKRIAVIMAQLEQADKKESKAYQEYQILQRDILEALSV